MEAIEQTTQQMQSSSSESSNASGQVRPSLRQRLTNNNQATTSPWGHKHPSTSRARLSRRCLLLEPQETVEDDDCTRRSPRAISTLKTEAFPFKVRLSHRDTSDIIHPRWAFPGDVYWSIPG
ncbi:hypothetical protein CDL15_Pgr021082 [Punica granatum]|uniref:Uncharacterized protein n=1 Tax=Punica granatum TaxID=22663 RepID=A0A218WRX0_PUNGR|nr:hypothetical protein CDL15_Pgr021082 [Punica granatum]PKI64631.1 hypothetical protein CRG98_014969 [Punica granatum]